MSGIDWSEASCASVGFGAADEWFPDKGGSNRQAKAICEGCPLRQECLDFALTEGLDHGIFGGLSVKERRALGAPRPRHERPINHGTEGGWKTHKRRGETPCSECVYATSEAKRVRDLRRAS